MSRLRHVTIEQPALPGARVWTTRVSANPQTGYAVRRHEHDVGELQWGASRIRTVAVADQTWVVPSQAGFWIPAGVPHEGHFSRETMYYRTFIHPRVSLPALPAPAMVSVGPALAALLDHLNRADLDPGARRRAERVVTDLIAPVCAASVALPMPTDRRLRTVAQALIADPADTRTLPTWGRTVGASPRTLMRLFLAETGMTFVQWRTQVRIRAALFLLTGDSNVGEAGRMVGYQTTSAFVRAFRQVTGRSPGSVLATDRHRGSEVSGALGTGLSMPSSSR